MFALGLQSQLISADVEDYSTAINSSLFDENLPLMILQVPPELIQAFAGSSGSDGGGVRVISALYYNVEDVFPSGRPGINKYYMASLVFKGRCGRMHVTMG